MKKNYLLFIALLVTYLANAQAPFITTWQVSGSDLSITVPIIEDDNIPDNYTIDFGDGTILDNQSGTVSHTYAIAGTYTVSLSGNFSKIKVLNDSIFSSPKLKTIEQWGDIEWTSMESAFQGCYELYMNAIDVPDLNKVTSMKNMFYGVSGFNNSLNDWNVSNVINMSGMFQHVDMFNQPLSNWNVSNVTDMSGMFAYAEHFNQPLNNWDVSNVVNMQSMFRDADFFNQPLDNWNVSNVTNMSYMFAYADTFNQPLNSWDVSNVIYMSVMFAAATSFNQPLDNWEVSNVTHMNGMFSGAATFNQQLNNWDVSNVTYMDEMFESATSFNQPIDNWDVSNVVYMNAMFKNAFLFNQPIDNWDISNVTYMHFMFEKAYAFNQDISSWEFRQFVSLYQFLDYCGLDINNYDALLSRFVQLGYQDLWLGSANLRYCNEEARDYLINELSWNINGDSLAEDCTADIPLFDENQVSIYPNPVNDFLHIENKSDVVVERVIIYNLQGRELIDMGENLSIIKVDNLSAGVYIVNLITDRGSLEYKLIKN